jgi:hypothetical protein
MRKHILALLLLAAVNAEAATSLAQNGITWTFAADMTTGQFANGDYYVVGPVTITNITPASTNVSGRIINGSMVNPAVVGGNVAHGFDNQGFAVGYLYSAALNAARPNGADLSAGNPLVLQPGSSLISTISKSAANQRPQLTDAAVLTVLGSVPSELCLRPPYCGTDKKLIPVSSLITSVMQELPDDAAVLASAPTLAECEGFIAKVHIETDTDVGGRTWHPSDNQPDYGGYLAGEYEKVLQLLQIRKYTLAERTNLFRLMVQKGLDIYGAVKAGGTWKANGGHNQGRKAPLVFAALATGDSDLLWYSDASNANRFHEDRAIFAVAQTHVDRTNNGTLYNPTGATSSGTDIVLTFTSHSIPSGTATGAVVVRLDGFLPTEYNGLWMVRAKTSTTATIWERHADAKAAPGVPATQLGTVTHLNTGWGPDGRSPLKAYSSSDIGLAEWSVKGTDFIAYLNAHWSATYRTVSGYPLPGAFMSIRVIPGGVAAWNRQLSWDYMDRYMLEEGPEASNNTNKVQVFTNNFWNAYRNYVPASGAPTVAVTTPSGNIGVTTTPYLSFAGTATDDGSVASVTWSNAGNSTSGTANGTTSWTIPFIDLASGANVITVRSFDDEGNASTAVTRTITYTPAGDTTVPTIAIVNPTGPTTVFDSPYTLMTGTAADNVAVSSVTWSNSTGGSGIATGTDTWSIAAIPLFSGENVITVRSVDTNGNLSTALTRTLTYTPPTPPTGSLETNTNPTNRGNF